MQKSLETFDRTNLLLDEYENEFTEVYVRLRGHFIKLFDSIFNQSKLFIEQKSGSSETKNEKMLIHENELLKARVNELTNSRSRDIKQSKDKNKSSKSPTQEVQINKIMKRAVQSSEQVNNSQNDSYLLKTGKRENSFLKSFNRQESASSLKDVIYRPITEQNLMDFVQDLYQTKRAHDIKSAESNFPRETMEQFMYGYLKKKYGLQPVIIERVLSVTMCIQEFSIINNDIAVFGLVLLKDFAE